jgi:rhodanese-related sulfurtransferase
MKKKKFLLVGLLFSILAFSSSCKKDSSDPINEAQVLADYLGDYVNTDPFPAMIKSSDVNASVLLGDGNVFVIDIRSAADFANGHITGAENVSLGDLLTYYETNNLSSKTTVAIVCYSGQTASYGASLLRMLGYTNVKAMKWGMSSWNPATKGSWVNNIKNTYATQMTTAAATKNEAGSLPVISTGKTTGPDILRARVEAAFAAGFDPAKITGQATFETSATSYILNYWGTDHYNVGHIPGAVQYTPKASLAPTQELKTLPTDKPVVVYCYTGQTSAFMAAYLRVLGYDAKSLLFGANGMMYDTMVADGTMTVFVEASDVHDYTLSTK